MQDDAGGSSLQRSLFGSSNGDSSGDIGIPDFNEDDYLDLFILNDDEDEGNVNVGNNHAGMESSASDGAMSQQPQQQQEAELKHDKASNNTALDTMQASSDDQALVKENGTTDGAEQQGQHQQADEENTASNDSSDRRSESDKSEQNESSASTVLSQPNEPAKPLTESPSAFSSIKLPNGDTSSQAATFPPPGTDSSGIRESTRQPSANGYKHSPSSSGRLPPHALSCDERS